MQCNSFLYERLNLYSISLLNVYFPQLITTHSHYTNLFLDRQSFFFCNISIYFSWNEYYTFHWISCIHKSYSLSLKRGYQNGLLSLCSIHTFILKQKIVRSLWNRWSLFRFINFEAMQYLLRNHSDSCMRFAQKCYGSNSDAWIVVLKTNTSAKKTLKWCVSSTVMKMFAFVN